MNEAQIRADQRDFARQQDVGGPIQNTIRLRKPLTRPGNKPQGHEAFLKALESSGAIVEVEKCSSGEKIVGKVKASDKYTISLRCPITSGDWDGPYTTRVLFKHDISEFSPLMPNNSVGIH